MGKGLVSIIIPCFNGQGYLPQTLESVRWQTYANWECILVDDGSTDQTAKIFLRFAKGDVRFKYIHQENSGPASARNRGIETAEGDFIQFLDADDLLLKNKLRLCVDRLQENSSLDVVYSDYVCYQAGRGFWRGLPSKIPHHDYLSAFLFENNITFVALTHSFLFRKNIMKTHQFDASLHSYAEDVECWVRIAASGAQFDYINQVLVVYRLLENSLATKEAPLIASKLKVLQRFSYLVTTPEYERAYHTTEQYLKERLAIGFFMEKDFQGGWRISRSVWHGAPFKSKVKMLGWLVLMMVLTKGQVVRLRSLIMKNTPLRWGRWKFYRAWKPPDSLLRLITLSNSSDG